MFKKLKIEQRAMLFYFIYANSIFILGIMGILNDYGWGILQMIPTIPFGPYAVVELCSNTSFTCYSSRSHYIIPSYFIFVILGTIWWGLITYLFRIIRSKLSSK